MILCNFDVRSIDDFIADDEYEIQKLKHTVTNTNIFPSAKKAILLHGTYGAGKTELARLLPREIERHRVDDFDQVSFDDLGFIFMSCASSGGTDIVRKSQPNTMSFHQSRLHYVILDEFDNLRADAQKNMKSFMTEYDHVIYIITTNHISKIDDGIKSRSVCISFENPSNELWFQKCRIVADDNNLDITDNEIRSLVNSANGDVRQIRSELEFCMLRNAA